MMCHMMSVCCIYLTLQKKAGYIKRVSVILQEKYAYDIPKTMEGLVSVGGREGGRKGRREGGREGGREGRREGGRKGGRERGREGAREGWREGETEGWRDGEKGYCAI